MDNSINYIAKQIVGTTREKIVFALLKEFVASNNLHITYNMSKEDFDLAFEDFKQVATGLPETLRFVNFT